MIGALALATTAACAGADRAPPAASFLLVAGDSTFWITSAEGRTHIQRSPILLAYIDNTFHEVYVADDDRSYFDAIIVGQRVYRRDLVRGDSVAVFEDSTLAAIAAKYGSAHPNERPLTEDEDAAPDPATVAVTETEIVDVLGSLAVLERHMDINLASGEQRHSTRREVIDLRTGASMPLSQFVPDSLRRAIVEAAELAFNAARDSIRASDDERAQLAAQHLEHFSLDTSSFALVVSPNGNPAISFFAPGGGAKGGDLGLPLEPVEVPPGPWWKDIAPALPTSRSAEADVWNSSRYDVVVSYDSLDATALVVIRDPEGEEWPVGSFPTPVWRVHRLDGRQVSSTTRRALARAFEESAAYSQEGRKSARWAAPAPGGEVAAMASRR